MEPETEKMRRRVEAARAYAGITSQEKLAVAIGMSRDTLLHRMTGRYPWRRGDLLAIAEICEVPVWFLEHGFEGSFSRVVEGGEKPIGDLVRRDRREAQGE